MYGKNIKRIIDFIFSLLILPFVLLLSLLIIILIKVDDGGDIFYLAPRLGKNGKVFKMFKFRSMRMNAPDLRNEDGSTYNSNDDPRVTAVGRILRKSSLDELPQIFNVLVGHMSFIGPRPDLPEQLNFYSDSELLKLNVRPGISGYSQAYFRNSISPTEKFKNDVYYVKNLSFLLAIKVLAVSLINIILKKNIYSNNNHKIEM